MNKVGCDVSHHINPAQLVRYIAPYILIVQGEFIW